MGYFYLMPPNRNHKRTVKFTFEIPAQDIKKLHDAIVGEKKWKGRQLTNTGEFYRVELEYGPVYGGFPSDLKRLLTQKHDFEYQNLQDYEEIWHHPQCKCQGGPGFETGNPFMHDDDDFE